MEQIKSKDIFYVHRGKKTNTKNVYLDSNILFSKIVIVAICSPEDLIWGNCWNYMFLWP